MKYKPVRLDFNYEIEIADGKTMTTDQIVRDCKLELNGHPFNINLIPFGNSSFDIIVGMDWLSENKAEILCYDKLVRIPMLNGNMLEVLL